MAGKVRVNDLEYARVYKCAGGNDMNKTRLPIQISNCFKSAENFAGDDEGKMRVFSNCMALGPAFLRCIEKKFEENTGNK